MDPFIRNETTSQTSQVNKTNQVEKTLTKIYNEDHNSSSLYDSALENITNNSAVNSTNESLFYDAPSANGQGKSPNHNSTFIEHEIQSSTILNDRSKNDILNMNSSDHGEASHHETLNNSLDTTLIQAEEGSDSKQSGTTSIKDTHLNNDTTSNSMYVRIDDIVNPMDTKEDPDEDMSYNRTASVSSKEIANAHNSDSALDTTKPDSEQSDEPLEKTSSLSSIISTDQTPTSSTTDVTSDRSKRAKTLVHASKQKLDIGIAEALAAQEANGAGGDSEHAVHDGRRDIQKATVNYPATKREIKIYDTLDEFEQNLPSTVTILDTPFGSRVYLVGTAHFSEDSQDDVSFVIRNVCPDVVMVELCPSRIHILKLDEKNLFEEAKNFNLLKIRDILKSHGYINGIFFILMLQMNAQIAKDLGMAPGGEFRRAFAEVHNLPGCIVNLGDRPFRITLHRALRALSFWQTCKLVWRLAFTDTITIEEVEQCKNNDLIEKLMGEMAGEFPAFTDVFVKERDLYLCHSLQMVSLPQALPGTHVTRPVRVVGVVGIGHAKGIAELWGKVDPKKIPEIMEIPPSSISTRVAKYTLKYGIIGVTVYVAYKIFRPRLGRFF